MNCPDNDIFLLLSDYFTGHLSKEDVQRVEAHLQECRTCRRSLRTIVLIAGREKVGSRSSEQGHFSPQLLGRYYADPGSLDPRLLQKLESHLAVCDLCSTDMAFLQDSDIDLRAVIRRQREGTGKVGWFARLRRFLTKS